MKTQQLWFARPGQVEIRQHTLPQLQADQVCVRNLYSAISAGTEMLVYRGQLPTELVLDSGLEAMKNRQVEYPLQYGYAAVGRVEQTGTQVDPAWKDKLVFAFQPHASHYITTPEQLVPVPAQTDPLAAVFLANTETAVNLMLDGRPQLGEKVVVLGQGVVGLLAAAMLARYPLGGLYTLDRIADRRAHALRLGVNSSSNPDSTAEVASLKSCLTIAENGRGADLVYELTGVPEVLNLAIDLCGYGSRIITGSWYGTRTAALQLGGSFHRNRISITSSQVSTIAPEHTGRWDKSRRFETAWQMISQISPEQLVTHRIPFAEAARAYDLLDRAPHEALQVVLEYPD